MRIIIQIIINLFLFKCDKIRIEIESDNICTARTFLGYVAGGRKESKRPIPHTYQPIYFGDRMLNIY